MSKADRQEEPVSKVYASALLDAAKASGVQDAVRAELTDLVSLLDADRKLDGFLLSPRVPEESRRDVLERAFRGRMSDLLLNTLQVMNRKGRADLIRSLCESYRHLHEADRGEVEVLVTTAVVLDVDAQARIARVVEKTTGRRPMIRTALDASILGGVVLRIGDKKLDASVSRQLERLRARLLERASLEIQGDRSYVTAE